MKLKKTKQKKKVKNRYLKLTFFGHLQELRLRLIYCLGTLLLGFVIGYTIRNSILRIILFPLGKPLFYTSPIEGFELSMKVSFLFAIVISLPVFIFNLIGFLEPAIDLFKRRYVYVFTISSFVLALLGLSFGYFVTLPLSLKFLSYFNSSGLIIPLITSDGYFKFFWFHLIGFAVFFQIPIVVLILNLLVGLKESVLIKAQSYVILICFVLAGIITPTTDVINLFVFAVPIILLYEFSIMLILIRRKFFS